PAIAQAMYLRARIYYTRGISYEPFTKKETQYETKRAKELADNAYARFPNSEGGINASNLVSQILQLSLSTQVEKVNVPGQPFRSLIRYKNIKTLYYRVIKTSRAELKSTDRREYEKLWKSYTDMKPLKSWAVTLPDLQDYQLHTTEIKIDGLPNGVYLILASVDPNFSLSKNFMTKTVTYVSNISFINNNNGEYYVLNRDNGQPLANTQVQVWESVYNYQSYGYEEKKGEKYTSDKNGMFKVVKGTNSYRDLMFQFNYGNDELFTDDNNYYNTYDSYTEVVKPQTFLFTDRAIYRPGQTVYFKGIVLKREKDAAKSSVIPNFNTRIFLKDANYQKLAELDVTTNDFGSFKGSFKLPEGLLNGQFSIWDTTTNNMVGFSVEEYKRPKFFVEVKKPKGTYKLNDSIKVTGTAKAYAGNNIDGAKVKYRVVRNVRYPFWWGWGYYRGYPRNAPVEITNGEMVTDAKGEFNIIFKALPDESAGKNSQPIFNYEVSADITDINGETRSSSTSVAVAYQALQLNILTVDKILVDSLKNLGITSTNLNDIFEKSKVNVTVNKVISPSKIFRERFWEMPDQFVMSKDEYYGYFPYDVYSDEDKVQTWPLGDKVYDKTDSTNENGEWLVGNGKWNAGWYKIVVTTKDKYGEDVRAEKYLQLLSGVEGGPRKGSSGVENPVTVTVPRHTYEPSEKISYTISTGFDNVWLIHTVSKMDKSNDANYQSIGSSNPFKDEITVNENDRGGMAISYAFVQHNRVYTGNDFFGIPWDNKQLTISYSTFRDKLLPGSQEKWKVKISGSKGEKVAAEMLAGMYDASLDQFRPHSWASLNIWPSLYNSVTWTKNGFNSTTSQQYEKMEYSYLTVPSKSYDRFNYIYPSYDGNMGFINFQHDMNPDVRWKDKSVSPPPPPPVAAGSKLEEVVVVGYGVQKKTAVTGSVSKANQERDADGILDQEDKERGSQSGTGDANIQVRKNFNETAFFFPDLQTDAEGNVEFSFTIPEALTKWKLMTLAHTKDLQSGYAEKTTLTQKVLMVQPNAPRFMREGDRMEFTVKIVNLADSEVTGQVQLELIDAASNKPVDGWFKNIFPVQYFTIAAGQSFAVKFPIDIPFNFNSALMYRVKAITKANNKGEVFSDGEEMAFPVLTNRMLLTESLPLNLRNQPTKNFKFEKLLNSGSSTTISNHALTVEYTSNPAWYAVQALP
ncbi:MAG TPA: alpha-2-macroglobulin family protein, partial [Chryseolinea sp.]|nr:alpha-2-macroglobulin family protein [Chryseolinea sp.]